MFSNSQPYCLLYTLYFMVRGELIFVFISEIQVNQTMESFVYRFKICNGVIKRTFQLPIARLISGQTVKSTPKQHAYKTTLTMS